MHHVGKARILVPALLLVVDVSTNP